MLLLNCCGELLTVNYCPSLGTSPWTQSSLLSVIDCHCHSDSAPAETPPVWMYASDARKVIWPKCVPVLQYRFHLRPMIEHMCTVYDCTTHIVERHFIVQSAVHRIAQEPDQWPLCVEKCFVFYR